MILFTAAAGENTIMSRVIVRAGSSIHYIPNRVTVKILNDCEFLRLEKKTELSTKKSVLDLEG